MNHYVFPAMIEQNQITGRYIVIFPDFPERVTGADTLERALSKAKSALEFELYFREGHNIPIPAASDSSSPAPPAEAEVFLIEADMLHIRQILDTKAVQKCVTLPQWLRDLGEERKVNFSQLLREALKGELGV